MLKEQAAIARRILRAYCQGKFDNNLRLDRHRVKTNSKSTELLQTYLNHYDQRCDWSDLDKDIEAFVTSLSIGHNGLDINRLISRCVRNQSTFSKYTTIEGFTRDLADISVRSRDKEYVYNVTPIRVTPRASLTSPCENIFFLEERGHRIACQIDDDIVISGHCMWRKLERVDESKCRFIFVDQYVKF
jgi:hypothetical protein